jgi:squalene synthase HpnC
VVSDAYATCLQIAHDHYENFPVASRLVPSSLRPHVAAVYAFARGADDIADEPGRSASERLELLEDWSAQLREPPRTAVFEALADTRARFDLPLSLFDDLLSAFKQDVHVTRYTDWADVLDYCRRSANPVGRLVLRLAGVRRVDADDWSDAVCSALQLTNFWQDFAIDWQRGRLYVPESTWRAAGAQLDDLDRGEMTPAWQAALDECASRTDALFAHGRPVCDVLSGRLRYELRATWLGGTRILQRVRDARFDMFRHRPTLGARDAIVIAWKALTWPATPRSTTRS